MAPTVNESRTRPPTPVKTVLRRPSGPRSPADGRCRSYAQLLLCGGALRKHVRRLAWAQPRPAGFQADDEPTWTGQSISIGEVLIGIQLRPRARYRPDQLGGWIVGAPYVMTA